MDAGPEGVELVGMHEEVRQCFTQYVILPGIPDVAAFAVQLERDVNDCLETAVYDTVSVPKILLLRDAIVVSVIGLFYAPARYLDIINEKVGMYAVTLYPLPNIIRPA